MSILAPLFLSLFLPGQPTGEIIAFTNARIHTVEGPVIDIGTLVVRGGKIVAVGDAKVPADATAPVASSMS